MYTHINIKAQHKFFTCDTEIKEEMGYSVGTTYEDYLDGKWVVLSEEQAAFHEEHPYASVKEVWDMLLEERVVPEHIETIEEVRYMKLRELEMYDRSESVNNFTINGANAWLTVEERLNYDRSLRAYQLLGLDTAKFVINDMAFEISIDLAHYMLAQILVYADAAYLATVQHKLNINSLETIEEVKEYNFTVGYPEQLHFDL